MENPVSAAAHKKSRRLVVIGRYECGVRENDDWMLSGPRDKAQRETARGIGLAGTVTAE